MKKVLLTVLTVSLAPTSTAYIGTPLSGMARRACPVALREAMMQREQELLHSVIGTEKGKHSGKKRRKHANKYKGESRAAPLDPWQEQLQQATSGKAEEEAAKEEERRLSRSRKRERGVVIFPDEADIDPYNPSSFGFLEIGRILGPHGVKGEVKVACVSDFGEQRFCTPGTRHIKAPNRRFPRPIELVSGRFQLNNVYIVYLKDIVTRDEATKLRGHLLYALEKDVPELDENEYMIGDLVGLSAYHLEDRDRLIGKVVGVVTSDELSDTGLGHDLLEMALPVEGSGGEGGRCKTCYIPFVPAMVPQVDLEAKLMLMDLPEGLLELAFVKEEKVKIRGLLPPPRD